MLQELKNFNTAQSSYSLIMIDGTSSYKFLSSSNVQSSATKPNYEGSLSSQSLGSSVSNSFQNSFIDPTLQIVATPTPLQRVDNTLTSSDQDYITETEKEIKEIVSKKTSKILLIVFSLFR